MNPLVRRAACGVQNFPLPRVSVGTLGFIWNDLTAVDPDENAARRTPHTARIPRS